MAILHSSVIKKVVYDEVNQMIFGLFTSKVRRLLSTAGVALAIELIMIIIGNKLVN